MKKVLLTILLVSGSLFAITGKAKKPRPCPKGSECLKGWTCDSKKKLCILKPSIKASKKLIRKNLADKIKKEAKK